VLHHVRVLVAQDLFIDPAAAVAAAA